MENRPEAGCQRGDEGSEVLRNKARGEEVMMIMANNY